MPVPCLYISSTFNFSHNSLYIAACTVALPLHMAECIISASLQLPEMIVERGIVVENHSVACIQIKRTNASFLFGASYALWKSQGWLKATLVALHHRPVAPSNASYCALKIAKSVMPMHAVHASNTDTSIILASS